MKERIKIAGVIKKPYGYGRGCSVSNRIYSTKGIAPTLPAQCNNLIPKILIYEKVKLIH